MGKSKYRETAFEMRGMPPGIPYIIANEAGERYSFYAMRGILLIFMTKYLMGVNGLAVMSDAEGREWYHMFTSFVYLTPVLGALLSDIFLGKFKTIVSVSIIYCLGLGILGINETALGLQIRQAGQGLTSVLPLIPTIDESRVCLLLGLTFIAIGSGGIKPCVSAHVGDQFGKLNNRLMSMVFSWFYFSINLGAFLSTLISPIVLQKYGPGLAFGTPAVLMILATVIFWMGRNTYAHVPPGGMAFLKETFSGDGVKALGGVALIMAFSIPFWSMFDQSGSAWIQQAMKMDRQLLWEWLPSQVQMVNPLMILCFIPLFSYVIYPTVSKVWKMTSLRKIGLGLAVATLTFVCSSLIEKSINGGDIVKYSSRAPSQLLDQAFLLDGEALGNGWSSADEPTTGTPQELIVRLREWKAWEISSVEIDPSTIILDEEITEKMKSLIFEAKKEKADAESDDEKSAIQVKITAFEEAIKAAKKKAKEERKLARIAQQELGADRQTIKQAMFKAASEAAREVASPVFEQYNIDLELLKDSAYFPKEVSIYTAVREDDFRKYDDYYNEKTFEGIKEKYKKHALLPKLISELKDDQDTFEKALQELNEKLEKDLEKGKLSEKKKQKINDKIDNLTNRNSRVIEKLADPTSATIQNGWTYIGDIVFDNDGSVGTLNFAAPVMATHVLVQIKSNYGGERVKLAEIAVNTTSAPAEGIKEATAAIWPNVANIGFKPHVIWQILAFVLLTAAEIMVSITCLEFAYTQAPKKMKSVIMSLYLLAVSFGNLFAAKVNSFIQLPDGMTTMEGADYYWFFTKVILATAVIFVIVALFYKEKSYVEVDQGNGEKKEE